MHGIRIRAKRFLSMPFLPEEFIQILSAPFFFLIFGNPIASILVSIAIVVVCLIWFKRKKWL